MSLDGLSQQFEQFVDRARTALGQEITAAKNTVAAANTEKTSAQTALAELREQHEQAQHQLDAVNNELGRALTLAGLNREIAAARKTLATLQAETAATEKALEALKRQRLDGERQLVALGNEAQRMIGIRTEGEAVMAKLRAQLQQVSIGQRP
jgi:predicted  nucleic acid-binding Zn-ribbon protein